MPVSNTRLYLKSVRMGPKSYRATFTSGATTDSSDVAGFFQIMSDNALALEDLDTYICLGEENDPNHDWKEIRRIAATFRPTPPRV